MKLFSYRNFPPYPNNHMGIEQLYGGWIVKLPYKGVSIKSLPKVRSLLLDFNGGIHKVAQSVYAYGEGKDRTKRKALEHFSDEQLENQYFQTIGLFIETLLSKIKPTDALAIGVDGVAVPAKINQQKSRRYKAAKEAAEAEEKAGPEELKSRFNSTCITPGTEFMDRLNGYLQSWIVTNRSYLPRLTIYSSHLVPGEGEHKLFRYLRDGIIPEGKDEGVHAVYGMDADLIMLSLLSPYDNIILIREDLNDIIDIAALKAGIISDMNGELLQNPINLGMDPQTAIRDFVVMAYLIGNDFLPRLMAFDDVGVALNQCIRIYREVYQSCEGKITLSDEKGAIDWRFLGNFLWLLAQEEKEMLSYKASIDYKYPSAMLASVSDRKEIVSEDFSRFNRFAPKFTINSFDFEEFRTLWYFNALGPRSGGGGLILEQENIDKVHTQDIVKMCRWYLYGLEWILNYYLGNIDYRLFLKNPPHVALPRVALDYIYPFMHAPLILDLAEMTINLVKAGENPLSLKIAPLYIGPHHQLVSVIPPQSSYLIPKDQRYLIMPGGHLSDLSPESFMVELQGKQKEYQGIAILPPFDLHRVIATVNTTLKKGHREAGTDHLTEIVPSKFREEDEWISKIVEKTNIPRSSFQLYPTREDEGQMPQGRDISSSYRGRGGGGDRGRGGGGDRGRGGGDRGRGGGGDRGRGGGGGDRGRGGGGGDRGRGGGGNRGRGGGGGDRGRGGGGNRYANFPKPRGEGSVFEMNQM